MKTDVFIPTQNFQKLDALCRELSGPSLGVEMAAVTGRAGRGKTTAAERIFSRNEDTVYVYYEEGWNHLNVLREIAFRLGGTRPRTRDACMEIIRTEMGARRRIIMVDEADRMPVRALNGLRNLHDTLGCPILLIGEDALRDNLARERRLVSRVRETMAFGPVQQADVVVFYKLALGLALSEAHSATLHRHSGGDFRRVITDAVRAERIMKASGLGGLTDQVLAEVCK